MNITSFTFVIFIFAIIIVYYLVPKKYQWVVLLVASAFFYSYVGIKPALFVLFTATTIFIATTLMDKISVNQKEYLEQNKEFLSKEERKQIKQGNQKKRKTIMIVTLLLNIGILCVTKYSHFVVDQLNSIISLFNNSLLIDNSFALIVPLGISFYTFQSIGYLLDVYWEKVEPQKNYFKFLLFVSFFPQMTQGPISEYGQLSSELYSEHTFTYKNYAYGMYRLLWGFAKKLLVACIAQVYVNNLFNNFENYTGITTLLGTFVYSIEIYADFSGYMDIMCGFCETLGIKLKENFDRPYFSKSVAEYWRRWHISLGDWFKNYIYYPIGMSNWNRKLAKQIKERFGTKLANTIPATIALIIVWTTTGLWHGANWGYIVWGLVNGLFIIFSMWMEPIYTNIKNKLHISDSNKIFSYFQIIRTFIIVSLIKVLPEVGSLERGLKLWKHIFTDYRIPNNLVQLVEFTTNDIDGSWLYIFIFMVVSLFFVSFFKKKFDIRESINKSPLLFRLVVITGFLMFVISFGGLALYSFGGGGFMYAGF